MLQVGVPPVPILPQNEWKEKWDTNVERIAPCDSTPVANREGWRIPTTCKVHRHSHRQRRRWQPDHESVLVGDGSCGAVALVRRCQRLRCHVRLISRLRLDAVLHDEPMPQRKSKRSPNPRKGARYPNLAVRLNDPTTLWQRATLPLYGGEDEQRRNSLIPILVGSQANGRLSRAHLNSYRVETEGRRP